MADFYENKQVTEEVILVGVALGETSVTDESLDELEELAKTAGAVTVGRLIQNREMIHPGTYLGKGKLEELAFLISETHATGIICDDELSPAQMAMTISTSSFSVRSIRILLSGWNPGSTREAW